MSRDTTVIPFRQPDAIDDPLWRSGFRSRKSQKKNWFQWST